MARIPTNPVLKTGREPIPKNCSARLMPAASRWHWRGLSRQGFKVNSIDTTATVHLEKGDAGFAISSIDLVTKGSVEGIDEAKFKEVARRGPRTAASSRKRSRLCQ